VQMPFGAFSGLGGQSISRRRRVEHIFKPSQETSSFQTPLCLCTAPCSPWGTLVLLH
jgi:hypothetical protein